MLALMEVPALGCTDYQIIEWQQRSVEQLATLKGLGVTAGTVIANRDGTGPALETKSLHSWLTACAGTSKTSLPTTMRHPIAGHLIGQ